MTEDKESDHAAAGAGSLENRRLAAIMFTDMVGYTALSQKDEKQALKLLEEHRKLLRPIFPEHGGREVKTIGDSFLVEFSSVVEAVRCAIAAQNMLHERNVAARENIVVRIGIHVGDVVHNERDVYGDAVNIASRIEPLSEPGGICVSQQVYDQIRNKSEFSAVALGKAQLKNIRPPVEIYKIILPWNRVSREKVMMSETNRIAVLPLANISPDSRDEYFADGLTEELISALSHISNLSVISRTSVLRYKNATKGIEEIGNELKVGTVLEGSVRKAGNRVRISVQLIDVRSDKHTWAETYDREIEDIFSIQSDIAQRVAESLKVRLVRDEKERIGKQRTQNTEAYTSYLRGRFYLNKHTVEDTQRAVKYFEQSLEKDPDYAPSYAGLSDCYTYFGDNLLKPVDAFPKAKEFAIRALELDDSLAEAHLSLALVLYQFQWDWSGAEREFKRAFELSPSFSMALFWYVAFLAVMGRLEEGWSEIKRAQELDPLSLTINTGVGGVFYFSRKYDQAIEQFGRVLEMDQNFAFARERLGLAFLEKFMFDEALAEFKKFSDLLPGTALAKD